LSGKATVRGGGEAGIPETVKLKLEIEIEAAYQKAYEAANSRLDTIDMPAAAGTHVIYDIGWYEQVFNSIVQYSMDGQVYEAPYTYKLQVPKLDNSRQVFCGTSTKSANAPTLPKSTSTPVSEKETNTPVPLPTSTPTSMQTGPRTVGDGFSDGNISLILTDYTIDSNTIDLIFVVKNESNRDILVRYQNSYFTLSDSTGKEYEHITQCEFDTKQELISSGKSVEIERGAPNMACRFDYLSYFKGTISESAEFLLVNVSKFMGLENVQWRIDL